LKSHKNASHFLTPVDPISLGIPDYLNIIKYPMDLQTVEVKLRDGAYSHNPTDFIADIRQIFMNAVIYNQPTSYVYTYAISMSHVFEGLLKKSSLPSSLPLGCGGSTRWLGASLAWKRVEM